MGGQNIWYLLIYDRDVLSIGYNPKVCIWTDASEAVNGELYEGSSASEDVNELLWIFWCAEWPEA